MRQTAWLSATAAPAFLIGGWSLAQSRQPRGYDALQDTISALAAHGAADAWIMTAGLAGLGASHLITAAGLHASGRAARAVLAVGGAATVVIAASPQPAAAHVPAATLGFLALAIWPAFTPGDLRAGRWFSVVLLVLLAWFASALTIGSLVGLSERVLAGAEALTPLAVLVVSRRQTQSAAHAQ